MITDLCVFSVQFEKWDGIHCSCRSYWFCG